MNIQNIFKNNQEWVNEKLSEDKDFFNKISKGQNPDLLYIGCSDSRVNAGAFMGTKPGEVFVHRNIANMVTPTDLNIMTVINFAVKQLKVEHVVVCGHYGCGGIKAAMEDSDSNILKPWLETIKAVYKKNQASLNLIDNKNDKYKKLVELNTLEQCENLKNTDCITEAISNKQLKIHAWVFDLESGNILDLKYKLKN